MRSRFGWAVSGAVAALLTTGAGGCASDPGTVSITSFAPTVAATWTCANTNKTCRSYRLNLYVQNDAAADTYKLTRLRLDANGTNLYDSFTSSHASCQYDPWHVAAGARSPNLSILIESQDSQTESGAAAWVPCNNAVPHWTAPEFYSPPTSGTFTVTLDGAFIDETAWTATASATL